MATPRTVTIHVGRTALTVPSVEACVRTSSAKPILVKLGMAPVVIGSDPELADVVLADERISRRHCTLQITESGLRLKDTGSTNGVYLGEAKIADAILPVGAVITLAGVASVTFRETALPQQVALTAGVSFGSALGASPPMRALFATLEQAASSDETILLLGESGTGKEVLASAIHDRSSRRKGPFLPFDCGAVSPHLIEATLFGHLRGAFTGATHDQLGALEASNGGTLFLDEIGELPVELQPKLLRALESRMVQPVGAREWRPFTGRVIAATHRDLRLAVRERLFREDLYYRIAVVNVRVPPLRERTEDIELLVEQFLHEMTPPRELAHLPPSSLAMLEKHDWPGNVRELKNTVKRLALFGDLSDAFESLVPEGRVAGLGSAFAATTLLELPLREARDDVVAQFERWFIREKVKGAEGNVSRAAAEMGVSRQFVHRLMAQHGMRPDRS